MDIKKIGLFSPDEFKEEIIKFNKKDGGTKEYRLAVMYEFVMEFLDEGMKSKWEKYAREALENKFHPSPEEMEDVMEKVADKIGESTLLENRENFENPDKE